MRNYDAVEEKLNWFFPHDKFMVEKKIFSMFSQGASEILCESWETYKSMLRRCSNQGFNELTKIHIFKNWIQKQPKLLVDSTVGVSIMSKSTEDAIAIIERVALSVHQGQHNRNTTQRKSGIIKLNTNDVILVRKQVIDVNNG